MSETRFLDVALVDGAIGNRIREVIRCPWSVMAARMSEPVRFAGRKVDAPAWLPVRLLPDAPMVRKDEHVAAVSCVVFDMDDGDRVDDLLPRLRALGLAGVLHTTWSHTAEHHKARVVFPLASDCPRDQWLEVWHCAEQWAATWGATIDKKCKNLSRLYFEPVLPADRWGQARADFRAEVFQGDLLHWRWLQAHHQPPKAPAPPPVPPKGPTWTGQDSRSLDREQRRRRAFAQAVVEHRARKLLAQGEGGRNARCYTAARTIEQLARAGAIDRHEGVAILRAAAITAGLSAKEADRAIYNGLAKGQEDPPWDFSTT